MLPSRAGQGEDHARHGSKGLSSEHGTNQLALRVKGRRVHLIIRVQWISPTPLRLAPSIDLVLLSHSSSAYLSLYPYARARWGLQCPVYATQPTVEMGRVVCLAEAESWRGEHYVSEAEEMNGEGSDTKGKKSMRGPFVPTVEEIHEAFDWTKPIRYNQPLHLGGGSQSGLDLMAIKLNHLTR